MEKTYEYSFDRKNKTLLIRQIVSEENTAEDSFEENMLLTCRIPGLLPVRRGYYNGQAVYAFDVRGCRPLSEKSPVDGESITLSRSLLAIQKTLASYLISPDHLVLEKELVFEDEGGSFSYVCLPFRQRDFAESAADLMESKRFEEDLSQKEKTCIGLFVRLMREKVDGYREIEEKLEAFLAGTKEDGPKDSSWGEKEAEERQPFRDPAEEEAVTAGPVRTSASPKEKISTGLGGIASWSFGRKLLVGTLVFFGLVTALFAALGSGFFKGSLPGVILSGLQKGITDLGRLISENPALCLLVPALILLLIMVIRRKKQEKADLEEMAEEGQGRLLWEAAEDDGERDPYRYCEVVPDDRNKGLLKGRKRTCQKAENWSRRPEDAAFSADEDADLYEGPPMGEAVKEVSPVRPPAHLISEEKPARDVLIHKERVVIGRDKSYSDLCLETDTVNRVHAVIKFLEGAYYLIDINSRNGTYLNGQALTDGRLWLLRDGDRIAFADRTFRFRVAEEDRTC